jgi:hypothetical protein
LFSYPSGRLETPTLKSGCFAGISDMETTYKASCHCARIQIEVTAELAEVVECNCSLCRRSGFLHWYVLPEQVKLLTTSTQLSTYAWRSITGGQHFCPTCGIAVIRTSTQYPPPISINARCLEGTDLSVVKVRQFDGEHLLR